MSRKESGSGAALRRSGAKAGNDIWVSGNIGDAAMAVAHRYGKLVLDEVKLPSAKIQALAPAILSSV